ncbi:hypothetical protein L1987_17171 [Smallanthus sonchifolius]|uniref:Uncharacterized protein n=1 Tax=Smallanthus sonchifolius TaxID=185202 RepID=A0ACB9IYC4_9ASTR|nr:hypothetical protein L1987_17171 [Smallanthus sonchifolius]
MEFFCSIMNLKKIVAISDHFPSCSSPRKKVVSGFVVGFVSFFVFLLILFSNSSFKNPDSDKLFILGFNNSTCSSSTTEIYIENSTQLEQSPKISAKVTDFKDTHVKNETFSAITMNHKEGEVAIGQEIGNGSVKSYGLDQDHGKNFQMLGNLCSSFEECDIFDGRWDYNCTVDFVSSPFLVRESSFKGENGSFETLRLDLMDQTTSMYQDADILIFNTGHWWTHEKTSRGYILQWKVITRKAIMFTQNSRLLMRIQGLFPHGPNG